MYSHSVQLIWKGPMLDNFYQRFSGEKPCKSSMDSNSPHRVHCVQSSNTVMTEINSSKQQLYAVTIMKRSTWRHIGTTIE